MTRSSLLLSVLLLLTANKAFASTDINGLFDARSHALGGSGVAWLDSAGAIPANPALLDQIGKLTLSLDVFYIRSQPEAPYTVWHTDANGQHYPAYDSIRSAAASAPLPFFGAAYRVHDRVVIGLAGYPVIGQGASADYKPAPDDMPGLMASNRASLGLLEAAVPVSIKLLDNLSLGLMWRVTYMTQSVSTPASTMVYPGVLVDKASNTVVNAKFDVTGVNFAGFELGLLYKPLPYLRVGLSYRSKVTVDGHGTARTKLGTTESVLDVQQGYSNPHAFRAGFALSLLNDKLLIAEDLKYLLYADAFKQLPTTTTDQKTGKSMTTLQNAYWMNSFSVHLGVEYKVASAVAVRLGYALVKSATNADYALAFFPPPGYSHQIMAGVGIRALDQLNVDLAGGYIVLASHVDTATKDNAGVGNYASRGFAVSTSVTYHM